MIELTLSVKGFDELVRTLHRARQGGETISVRRAVPHEEPATAPMTGAPL